MGQFQERRFSRTDNFKVTKLMEFPNTSFIIMVFGLLNLHYYYLISQKLCAHMYRYDRNQRVLGAGEYLRDGSLNDPITTDG